MFRLCAGLLVFSLAGSVEAQVKAPYSTLHVTRASIRFFPSEAEYPPLDERVYPERIDSATTAYINVELSLDYPATTTLVGFRLACSYVGPRGENAGTPAVDGNIPVGWKGSIHAGGWGNKVRGGFAVGTYRVTCREGDDVVASGSFVVSRDQFDIPAVRAMVARIKMYESPGGETELSQRRYASRFDSTATRGILTQLDFVLPRAGAKVSFPIECVYRYPDGSEHPFQWEPHVEPRWNRSQAASGQVRPGGWSKGVYGVTCLHQGRVIARRSFTVY